MIRQCPDGRAAGVELEDGTEVSARGVGGLRDPPDHLPRPVGEEHLPPEVVRDIRRYRTRSGSVKGNLTVGGLPAPAAWDGPGARRPPPGPHRHLPSREYLERAWDEAKYVGTSSEPLHRDDVPHGPRAGAGPGGEARHRCPSPSSGRPSSAGGPGRRSGRPTGRR
jgi:hypothetical protein